MKTGGSAPGSQSSLRRANRERVVETLSAHGPLTQVEISGATGLSPATISNLVRDLDADGEVALSNSVRNGRRAVLVALAEGGPLLAGVAFGDRDIRVAIGTGPNDVIASQRMPLPQDHHADEGLDRAARLLHDLLVDNGRSVPDLDQVALGLPAPVDSVTGAVGSELIMPGWRGVPAAAELETALRAPVVLDNTANLAAEGELLAGALSRVSTGAYLKLSHGVGAGLVIGGRVFRGSAGTAGEIGHVTIDEAGPVCRCGNRGCLNTYVGSPALIAAIAPSQGPIGLRDIVARAQQGDPGCRRVIVDAGRHLGVAVAGLVNLLNPEVIAVGGQLARTGDLLLDAMREGVERSAIPSAAASVVLVLGALGDEADVRGALLRAATARSARVG
ncbi:ROK family transcriptional regulator [Janibacter sp. CX7]|uniref:ROK family transcriptional regulator n=1 Tax=Janibacter sp. CX7 TaxID=2963431 RepID=UPI0020CD72F9|nr:ROK family transcriptional regulator [Janibacter sp. CX7]UTT67091.1 ROK family transcriptional regulator [Janibacter sp. CX7]